MPCYIFSTAVKRLKGKQDNDNVLRTPVARLDGSICATADEVAKRWTEHYESTLNQSAANLCSELNDLAASATPDTSIAEDAPTLEEVVRAVRRLRNGCMSSRIWRNSSRAPKICRGPNQSGSSRPLLNRLVVWQSSSRVERGYSSVLI